jgi:histidinol-phosphatase (PHP family)
MIKLIDSHVHTHYSHGDAELFEMVLDAIDRGVENIGFSEHYLRCPNERMPILKGSPFHREDRDFEHYLNAAKRAEAFFAGKIEIRTGLEVDYLSGNDDYIIKGLAGTALDYIMGSVHFVGVPNMYVREHDYLKGDALVRVYLDETKGLIKSGLFDVLSHPELISYDNKIDQKRYGADFEEITSMLKKANMGIELNTSYISAESKERILETLNPGLDWLKLCIAADLPIVLGSDAHRPGEIALNFEKIMPILKGLGIKRLAYYVRRKPVFYEI